MVSNSAFGLHFPNNYFSVSNLVLTVAIIVALAILRVYILVVCCLGVKKKKKEILIFFTLFDSSQTICFSFETSVISFDCYKDIVK